MTRLSEGVDRLQKGGIDVVLLDLSLPDAKGLEACDRFDFLTPFHGDVKQENLRRLRDLGPDDWLKRRPPFYRWS